MYGKNYDDFYTVSVYTVYFYQGRELTAVVNHMQKLTAVRRLEKVKLTSRFFKVITIFSKLPQFVKYR